MHKVCEIRLSQLVLPRIVAVNHNLTKGVHASYQTTKITFDCRAAEAVGVSLL